MAMKRRPNNSGSVVKVSGTRSKPFLARLPARIIWDEDKYKAISKRPTLGYFETESLAWKAIAKYRELHPEKFDYVSKNALGTLTPNVTVEDLWKRYTDSVDFRRISSSTQGNYTAVYNKYLVPLHKTPITEIKASTLSTLINSIDKKSGTKKNALTVMRTLMNIAMADDIIQKNYADFVKFENDETEIVRELFTKKELDKMWQHTDDWIFQLLLIMAYSGSRITELLNVRKEDIHINEGYYHISEGKNKFARRNVPIHSAILELFNELMQNSPNI